MATEIRVPKIGASVTKASIGRWFKRVGDPVRLNEPLVEIEVMARISTSKRRRPAFCRIFS